MQDSLLYIVLALIVILIGAIAINIYLLINRKDKKEQDKLVEETNRLREDLNKSIGDMSSSFNKDFTSLSKDVTRDLASSLTQVNEKVGVFNKQVEDLNRSQASFSKILAGVKSTELWPSLVWPLYSKTYCLPLNILPTSK